MEMYVVRVWCPRDNYGMAVTLNGLLYVDSNMMQLIIALINIVLFSARYTYIS